MKLIRLLLSTVFAFSSIHAMHDNNGYNIKNELENIENSDIAHDLLIQQNASTPTNLLIQSGTNFQTVPVHLDNVQQTAVHQTGASLLFPIELNRNDQPIQTSLLMHTNTVRPKNFVTKNNLRDKTQHN